MHGKFYAAGVKTEGLCEVWILPLYLSQRRATGGYDVLVELTITLLQLSGIIFVLALLVDVLRREALFFQPNRELLVSLLLPLGKG